MAIATLQSHTLRALSFYANTSIYFSIGKTSAWADDAVPPAPDSSTEDLSEIIGYKAIETKNMVIPDEVNGTILYRGGKWRIVTSDQATCIAEGSRWVYLSCAIIYDELPLVSYRQIGVYTGLQRAPGNVNTTLLPQEVVDNGILEILDNRQPSSRQIDQKDTLSIIIEF